MKLTPDCKVLGFWIPGTCNALIDSVQALLWEFCLLAELNTCFGDRSGVERAAEDE